MELKFQVQLKIRKPVAEVFDAVVNPKKLSGYFVETASGPLAAGKTVKWKFPEFPDEFDVVVREVVKDDRIVFEWPAGEGDANTRVEMVFKPLDAENTMVQISESGWQDTAKGRERAYGNAGGWMHMAACLKAYLEYGINLREGGALLKAPSLTSALALRRLRAGEERHVIRQRLLKGRPLFAATLVGVEHRHFRNNVGVAQDSQHRRHQKVARRETPFQIVASVEPG